MMPFSVFRSFFSFLINWAILGAGIYFAYDAFKSFNENDHAPEVVRVPEVLLNEKSPPENLRAGDPPSIQPGVNDRADQDRVVVVNDSEDPWMRWGKVAIAALCLGISIGGRMPLKLIMKTGAASTTNDISTNDVPSATVEVSRPDGSQLHCEIFGSDEKPTLLLTHGWSLDSSAWRYMRPVLTKEYRVVVWDLPGLGKSRGPSNNDYSLEKMACDLNAVLEHVAPNGPAILIGHSIGGMIQQTFCRLHANKLESVVKGFVLLHTTYTNPLDTNILAGIVKPLQPVVSLMNAVMIPLAPIMWLSNWQSYFNGSAHWFARLESFTGKQTWQQLDHSAKLGAAASPSVLARGNFGMMKFNEESTLPMVKVPVLVVSSPNDRLTIQSASKHIEQLLHTDTPHADNGGHLGHWEYNEQVSQAILNFALRAFKRVTRPALNSATQAFQIEK